LGIVPERIEPGQPQQNGRHERLHRTLKAQVARWPRGNRKAQQRAFNRFRYEYNHLRPHEALGQTPPARHYHSSQRPFHPPVDPEYPDHFTLRLANSSGDISYRQNVIHLSRPLAGEIVGLEPIADGRWVLWFGPVLLGSIIDKAKGGIDFFPHT
jgi:hypothetical protein